MSMRANLTTLPDSLLPVFTHLKHEQLITGDSGREINVMFVNFKGSAAAIYSELFSFTVYEQKKYRLYTYCVLFSVRCWITLVNMVNVGNIKTAEMYQQLDSIWQNSLRMYCARVFAPSEGV